MNAFMTPAILQHNRPAPGVPPLGDEEAEWLPDQPEFQHAEAESEEELSDSYPEPYRGDVHDIAERMAAPKDAVSEHLITTVF